MLAALVTFATWLLAQDSAPIGEESQCLARDQTACSCPEELFSRLQGTNDHVSPCFPVTTQTPNADTVDRLAVSAFAALNWPMDPGAARGTPDLLAPHQGTQEAFLDYVPVWESWRATTDIFRPDGEPPVAWEAQNSWLPPACEGVTLTDAQRQDYAWANIPDSPLPPRLLSGYQNPGGEVLIDASGQPVRFEVLFNRQAYDYVVDHRLWSLRDLTEFINLNGALQFPEGHQNESPVDGGPAGSRGAIIIKAAWKILDPKEPKDNTDRFHKAWAYVTPVVRDGVPVDDCKIVPVGLVGMHIILKIDTFPSWLWSTFENTALAPNWDQLAYLPDDSAGDRDRGWLFFADSRECTAFRACQGFTAMNTPPVLTWPEGASHPSFVPNPSRIISQQPPGHYRSDFGDPCNRGDRDKPSFACLNADLQTGFANSAMQNYVFKGAQWLDGTAAEGDISNAFLGYLSPEILANAAMESFDQATSNCYACHMDAGSSFTPVDDDHPRSQDAVFDFIFSFEHIPGVRN